MKTIEKVMHYLNNDPVCRDNDNMLIAKVWFDEMSNAQKTEPTVQFLIDFSEGKYSSAESILRCRQKLQQEFPGLRGKSYMARHNISYEQLFI